MSKSINIKYQWNEALFVEAAKATYEFELRHSPKRFLGWFFIAMTQFGVVGALKKDAYGLLVIATLLVIYWYALRWPVRKYMIQKSFANQATKNHTFSMSANNEAIVVDGVSIKWESVSEVVNLEKGFLLLIAGEFIYIPKSGFSDDSLKDEFSHLLKREVFAYKKEY